MWPHRVSHRYEALALDDRSTQLPVSTPAPHDDRRRPTPLWRLWTGRALIALLILIAAAGTIHLPFLTSSHDRLAEQSVAPETSSSTATPPPAVQNCTTRQEWRTLTTAEQQAYISAVLCLRTQSSVLNLARLQSSYDDFPFVHSHVGYYTHGSAPFLPWHRYFLHIYETTLREKCGYQGSLVYWDWTIDSEALEHSPIFDPNAGFGGDGQNGGEITVGRTGRCVYDGPFAGVNVSFYDVKFNPHCLSRGFRDQEGNLGHIDGHDISPASIDEVLDLDKYEDFVTSMESKVHDTIPYGIGGDFETFTAPYDPIFFLHHTQLDRLWWLWQQRDQGARQNQYGGHKQRHSVEMASLEDEINMKGLAPSVKVAEMMDTRSGFLCYDY